MNLSPILSFIRSHEAPKGYNQVWGGIKKQHLPPKPLTQMTVRQVLKWQDSIDPLYRSEAAGAYQAMEDTLRAQFAAAGLGLDGLFDEEAQDRFAVHLMRNRGLDAYLAGHMTAEQFANSLAKEWASLPVVTPVRRTANGRTWIVPAGASYYSGDGLNKALTPTGPFLAAVKGIKRSSTPAKPQPPSTGKKPGSGTVVVGGGFAGGAVIAAVYSWWNEISAWFATLFGG